MFTNEETNEETHKTQNPVTGLLNTLRSRRTRRFGLGMKMASGPMAFESQQPGVPLTEEEEALLVYAACGLTGYALADLVFDKGQGGTIMSGLVGRTVASGDGIQTVGLVVMNQEATYYIKRAQDSSPDEIPELLRLAEQQDYVELYRRSRVKIQEGRSVPPAEPLYNLDVNRWSLYDPAATYFLPINEFTQMYINGLLEIFNETTGVYVVDERAGFQPAGLKPFARSRGGHLEDDAKQERTITIQQLEQLVIEFVTLEQGMILQNLGLMVQALGLGGFPHWGAHPYGWFEALGFRMGEMKSSQYLGLSKLLALGLKLLGQDQPVPYVQGLEHDGRPLLKPFCPPYYPSMAAAVQAVADRKFGPSGIFTGAVQQSAWRDPVAVGSAATPTSPAAIAATTAYCDYVFNRYGRFPAYSPPLRTILGFQVNHIDPDFYDRFYHPNALSETQRQHMEQWHTG
ncbi:MAG: hypothetical protein KDJ52_33415 [Anaerolineae bacterium]|nr:hypothetical protein [Anaerolineae bacterium]